MSNVEEAEMSDVHNSGTGISMLVFGLHNV